MKGGRFKALCLVFHFNLILSTAPLILGFSIKKTSQNNSASSYNPETHQRADVSVYPFPAPEHRKSNLEMLLTLNPAFNTFKSGAKLKSDIGTLNRPRPALPIAGYAHVKEDEEIPTEKFRFGVQPVTHEEIDPLPLPVLGVPSTSASILNPAEDIISAQPPSTSSVVPSTTNIPIVPIKVKMNVTMSSAATTTTTTTTTKKEKPSSSSIEEELFSGIKEDQPRPMTDFQNIKDAYFDLLQQFKEFRKATSQKIAVLEQQLKVHVVSSNKTGEMDTMSTKIVDMYEKLIDMDQRHNQTRLMNFCVNKIIADDLPDATALWQKIEMSISNPVDVESANILKEIVTSAYIRNKSNENPVFKFLRNLQDVDKVASYEFLIKEMMKRENFDGAEIFHIAHYLKEHNAVRSPLYSRIPKAVQYAVSGRNVNLIFTDGKTGRFYLHVRDDGDRRERHNFYVKASQSYTDSKAAVWRAVYYESTQSFRIRNILFNDYLLINSEGFLEPTYATNANQLGTEFEFVLEKNQIILKSKSYGEQELVSTWGGGRFPFYFSLRTVAGNEKKPPALFLIEPDTLL